MVKRKTKFYGTTLRQLDKYERSTGVCYVCGYVGPRLSTDIEFWTCPECGTKHQRDDCASKWVDKITWERYLKEIS